MDLGLCQPVRDASPRAGAGVVRVVEDSVLFLDGEASRMGGASALHSWPGLAPAWTQQAPGQLSCLFLFGLHSCFG
jgi:hypothetical protein